jgi:hypothetical protein
MRTENDFTVGEHEDYKEIKQRIVTVLAGDAAKGGE